MFFIVMNQWNDSVFYGTYQECKQWAKKHAVELGRAYGIVPEL